MKIRKRNLSEGWYPNSPDQVKKLVNTWTSSKETGKTLAGIVPHAGWSYCGRMIVRALETLSDNLNCVVVLGGHNPSGAPLVTYDDDLWELPTGVLRRDSELTSRVHARLPSDMKTIDEWTADNTIEVIMPLIAAMYPRLRWAAWRVPSDERSLAFGEILHASASDLGLRIGVVGSTDLTHYGPDYRFMPRESRKNPAAWVAKRDGKFLETISTFRGVEALKMANADHSACSVGAALAAMAYAQEAGCIPGRILSQATSQDVHSASSFVGYGSIIWESP